MYEKHYEEVDESMECSIKCLTLSAAFFLCIRHIFFVQLLIATRSIYACLACHFVTPLFTSSEGYGVVTL